jgi:hypothetical protein
LAAAFRQDLAQYRNRCRTTKACWKLAFVVLRDTLLPKLMFGELRVKNEEGLVEEATE